jgi:type IV secretion system protein VirB8
MNKPSREALDAYYREAESWGRDREEALRTSRKIAWIVAGATLFVAVLLAVALVILLPLKRVQPYTILVDRQTGHVQALDPLHPARISGDAALTQSFLAQYVIAREGFDIASVRGDYRKVALWSAESARSSYVALMQGSNPESPLARLPRSTTIEVRVKSVSPVGRNVAMVRFDTRRQDIGGQAQPPSAWVAMIRYRYSGEPMSMEDRLINPLGFQVLRYRRDQEALAPDAAATPAGSPPTAAGPTSQPPATSQQIQPQPGNRP